MAKYLTLAALWPAAVEGFSSMPHGGEQPTCPEPTMFDTLDAAKMMAQMVARAQSPSPMALNEIMVRA